MLKPDDGALYPEFMLIKPGRSGPVAKLKVAGELTITLVNVKAVCWVVTPLKVKLVLVLRVPLGIKEILYVPGGRLAKTVGTVP